MFKVTIYFEHHVTIILSANNIIEINKKVLHMCRWWLGLKPTQGLRQSPGLQQHRLGHVLGDALNSLE